jgi:Fe-S oxidoreductase
LRYEKTGNSPLFSWYGLPEQCDTVFFPGCTFAGTRSQTTWELFTYIRQHLPAVGVVLDCCGKPSHDLGRQEQFLQKFEVMNQYLVEKGVHKVLVTCPNCLAVFKQYGRGVEAITVYQFIARHGLPSTAKVMGRCVIHDPCSIRGEEETHAAVRELTGEKGVEFEELNRRMGTTLCCGEGGAVGFVRPEFAEKWTRMRGEQAKGKNILTYCAGCATSLSRHCSVWHILDLIFFPVEVTEGRFRTTRTPFTYLRRLILKMRLRRLPGLEDDRA